MKLLIGFLTVAVLVLGYVIYRVENRIVPEPVPEVVAEEPKASPPVKVLPKIEPKKVENKTPPIKLEAPKTEPRFELKIRSGHVIQHTPSGTNEKVRPK